jgi:hypothetical protein
MSRPGQFGRWIWLWAACYVVLVSVIAWSMFAARRWAVAELASPAAQSDWQAWREDVKRQQTESAPVRLRVPQSPEPPAAVLLRDYFGVLMTATVVLSSFLFWVVAWLASGAVAAKTADKQTPTHAGREAGG